MSDLDLWPPRSCALDSCRLEREELLAEAVAIESRMTAEIANVKAEGVELATAFSRRAQVALGVEANREDCYIIPADEIQGKKEEILGMRAAVATSLKNLKARERKQSHARGNWNIELYGEEVMEGFRKQHRVFEMAKNSKIARLQEEVFRLVMGEGYGGAGETAARGGAVTSHQGAREGAKSREVAKSREKQRRSKSASAVIGRREVEREDTAAGDTGEDIMAGGRQEDEADEGDVTVEQEVEGEEKEQQDGEAPQQKEVEALQQDIKVEIVQQEEIGRQGQQQQTVETQGQQQMETQGQQQEENVKSSRKRTRSRSRSRSSLRLALARSVEEDTASAKKVVRVQRSRSGEVELIAELRRNGHIQESQHIEAGGIKREAEVVNFQCRECEIAFSTAAAVFSHAETSHWSGSGGSQDCPVMACIYKGRRTGLPNHIRIHHSGERLFSCEECGMTFNSVGAKFSHVKNHKDRYKDFCQDCRRFFRCNQPCRGCTGKRTA